MSADKPEANTNAIPATSTTNNDGSSSATTSAVSTPWTTFTCFPRLNATPAIQQLIWKAVCFSQPRVIDIFFAPAKMRDVRERDRDILSMHSDMHQDKSYTTVTSSHPPAVLHTSRQAREVALRYYSLAFGNTVGSFQLDLPPKIYVNWNIDIICPMKTFQLVDHEGDGLALGSATQALGTNTDMRRLACSIKELTFFKKILPKLRLDEVIVYLAPGLDRWQRDRIEHTLENDDEFGWGSYNYNISAKLSVRFEDWRGSRHLNGLDEPEDSDDDEAWQVYNDTFVPIVKKAKFGDVEKKLLLVAEELRKKSEGTGWRVPEFKAMVLEVHEKDDWIRHQCP